MTALRWTVRAFRYDQKAFWRTPGAPIFTVAMPVLMLVVFGTLNRGGVDSRLGVSYSRYLVVGMISFSLATTAYGTLTARVTYRRETGIYQRLRTTPLPAGALVAGQIAGAVVLVAGVAAVLLVLGMAFFGATAPGNWALFLAVVALGAGACCAVGVAVSTFIPSVESIDPVIWGTVMPVTFISGTFQYVPPHSVLGRVADIFPVRHILVPALRSFDVPAVHGSMWPHFAVLVAWTAAGAVVAVRRFRWAPRRA